MVYVFMLDTYLRLKERQLVLAYCILRLLAGHLERIMGRGKRSHFQGTTTHNGRPTSVR
jgi:hypothetical protein